MNTSQTGELLEVRAEIFEVSCVPRFIGCLAFAETGESELRQDINEAFRACRAAEVLRKSLKVDG